MMADNWGFVAAAYGLTAVVIALYWRRLERGERDLEKRSRERDVGERGHDPSRTGHPRSEPDSRPPLQ